MGVGAEMVGCCWFVAYGVFCWRGGGGAWGVWARVLIGILILLHIVLAGFELGYYFGWLGLLKSLLLSLSLLVLLAMLKIVMSMAAVLSVLVCCLCWSCWSRFKVGLSRPSLPLPPLECDGSVMPTVEHASASAGMPRPSL
ncbi:hypothetical protein U1Q18_009234 [Sarracenia purpurea var. burkii]